MVAPWFLRASGTGCSNWASIKIGDATEETSVNDCGHRCAATDGCVGFGYQAQEECSAGGVKVGYCLLWSGSCSSGANSCFDDYTMALPAPRRRLQELRPAEEPPMSSSSSQQDSPADLIVV
jgi:hypothetical protein